MFAPENFSITVDLGNAIDESNEANNTATATVGTGVANGPNTFSCQ